MTTTIASLVADHLDLWTSATQRKSGAGRGGGGKRISLYGIERLRALILDLAVRGKLVPQDAGDEPAGELLKRFVLQRSDWISKKRMRNGKPLPKLAASNLRFEAPLGWAWIRFGHLGDWGAGATPNRKKSVYYGGDIPWFKSGELSADSISASEESVTELALKDCSLRLNRPGDVLIAMYGATIGKASILEVEATTNQAVCACTPYDGVDNRFLLLLLKGMKPIFVGQGAGGAQPNISREKIIATPLALPPLAEQRRIVAKVDELMAHCDALERESADAMAAHQALVQALLATLVSSADAAELATNWARLEQHFDTLFTTEASIDALKQTILDLAVRGKLVEQDAGDEAVSEFLNFMGESKKALIQSGSIKKAKPVEPINIDATPHPIPTSWAWRRLSDATHLVTDGEHLTPRRVDDPNGVPLVTAKNVRAGTMDYTVTDFVSRETAESCWQRCRPEQNDILLVSVGATIGRHTIVSDYREMVIVRSVTLIKADHTFIPYLSCVFGSQMMQKQIWGGVRQSAQPCLYLNVSNALQVPIPPLAEQQRIVAKVDALMALCDSLKARITDAAATQKHLADAIVERAAA